MEKIKSFIEWASNIENEFESRLKEAVDEYLHEDMKNLEDIRDMTLKYQDVGIDFFFNIGVSTKNANYSIYTSTNMGSWVIDNTLKQKKLVLLKWISSGELNIFLYFQAYLKNGEIVRSNIVDEIDKEINSRFGDEYKIYPNSAQKSWTLEKLRY